MIAKNFKLIFSDKRMLLLCGILIILLTAGILFAATADASAHIRIGIADEDNTEYSKLLISYFKENEVFSSYVEVHEDSLDNTVESFNKGELDFYLVIPPEFTERLIYIQNTPIRAVIDSSDITKCIAYQNLLKSYAKYISSVEINCQALYELMGIEGFTQEQTDRVNVSISYELIFTALGKDSFFNSIEIDRIKGMNLVNYYIFAGIGILIMYFGVFSGSLALRERLSGVGRRLKAINNLNTRNFAGRLFSAFTVIEGMCLITFAILDSCGKLTLSFDRILQITMFILLTLLFFMLSGLFFKSEGGYLFFANMLVLFLSIIGGGIIPIMYLPEAVAGFAEYTPLYRFISIML